MRQVATLQERLEARALERAKHDAEAAINALPRFDTVTCWAMDENGTNIGKVNTSSYHLCEGLKVAIRVELYKLYLEEETQSLLEACERVKDIANGGMSDE